MGLSRCPSCDHEIFDRSAATCPFCGRGLGRTGGAGSPGSPSSGSRARILMLVAMLLLMLVAGITAFLAAAGK